MQIFIIELIAEFISVLHKLMWHQSKSVLNNSKEFLNYTGFELNVKFCGHVGFLLPVQIQFDINSTTILYQHQYLISHIPCQY